MAARTLAAPPRGSPSPARARGLSATRAHAQRAGYAPVTPTPLPAAVDAVDALALLTRVRTRAVEAGALSVRQRYDVRAFKCAWAELAYLRRLAAGGRTGGTVITSMAQLVAGLASLHPAWTMSGDRFADRDRHHSAVRRRLSVLQAMGLLRWRAGVTLEGEEARTEIELLAVPQISEEERATARERLQRWRARYGPALNTGSCSGVRSVAVAAAPLSAQESRRRGRERACARAQAGMVVGSLTVSAPPFGAPPSSENYLEPSSNRAQGSSACGSRTGVTRARDPASPNVGAALEKPRTAAAREEGPGRPDAREAPLDETALLERVAARQAARAPVIEAIAVQAARRAAEVASWPVSRGWPAGRLREAWVVARHGPRLAAEAGAAAAGPLGVEDLERLQRAAARYERHVAAAPAGFPAGGLGALLHIAAIAAQRDARPLVLAYGIRALDQLSKRMRAVTTHADPQRYDRLVSRATRRRTPHSATRWSFRGGAWPTWVALDDHGNPLLVDGELQAVEGAWAAPARHDPLFVAVERDARLTAGLWLAAHHDGRQVMADNSTPSSSGAARAIPGPYGAPGRDDVDPDVLELAHRADLSLRAACAVQPQVRVQILTDEREHERREQIADAQRFADHLATIEYPHGHTQ